MAADDRVAQIDGRLNEIGIREQGTQSEQLLVLLAQERLALTNERISLTSQQAPAPGNYSDFIELFSKHILFFLPLFLLLFIIIIMTTIILHILLFLYL